MIPTKVDPDHLATLELLRREGMTYRQIQKALNISQRTYFRRVSELRRVEQEALKLMRADA